MIVTNKWPVVRLSTLAVGTKGAIAGGPFGSDLVSRDYVASGVPVIRGGNLSNHAKFSFDDLVFVTENKADAHHLNCAHPGDLVFTQRGTLGQVGLLPKNSPYSRFLISQSQMKMTVDPGRADSLYLYNYFRLPSTVSYIENHALQSGVPHINLGILKKLQIICPPLSVQKKISAVISAYDELIENNQRRIALLEKMAEEIYREWFVRLRFPGYEKVIFVKGVPQGWEVRTLSSFASEIKKGVKKKNLSDDEKYIGLEHIPRHSISIKEWATADTVDSDKLLFQERDILFCKIRPYLHKVALSHVAGACSSDTIVIRPMNEIYEGYLLFTVFSDTFIELATVASKGTKMPRADWGFLKKLELAVPSTQLLEAYQAHFNILFAQIVTLLRENEILVTARDLLLPRLVSGKLSVENLDIQFPPSMKEPIHET